MCVNLYIYDYICICMCICVYIYTLLYIYTVYKIKILQPSIRSHGLGNSKTQIGSHYLVNIKLFTWKAKLPESDHR